MPRLKRKHCSSSESSSDDECLLTSKLKKSRDKLAQQYCINPENSLFGFSSVICDVCDEVFTNRIEALVHNTKHIIVPLIKFQTLGDFYQYHTEDLRQNKPEIQHHKQESMLHHKDELLHNEEVILDTDEIIHHKEELLKEVENKVEMIHHEGNITCRKDLILMTGNVMHAKQKHIPNMDEIILNKKDMILEEIHSREVAEEYILPDSYMPELPINLMNNDLMTHVRSRIIFDDDDDNVINISDDESVLDKITSDCKVNLGEPMLLNKIVLGKPNTHKSNIKDTANTKVLENFTSDCKVVLRDALPFSLADILTDKTECALTESNAILTSFLNSDCKVNLEPIMFEEEIMCDNEPFDTAVESLRLEILAESLGGEQNVLPTMGEVETIEIDDDDDDDVYVSVHYDELTIPSLHRCKSCQHTFPNKFDLIHHSTRHLRIRGPDPRHCLFCNAAPLTVDVKLPICRACLDTRQLTLVKKHGAVICAFCQTRWLTVNDLATHLKSHYDNPAKVYSGLMAVCEVCAVFDFRRDGSLKYTHVGDIKEVGVKQRCEKCSSSCYTAQIYQRSKRIGPPPNPEPAAKTHYEQQYRFRPNDSVKAKFKPAKSNVHRLKNIQHRLKIMKGV